MKDRPDILSGLPYNYSVSVEIGIIYSVNRKSNLYIVKGLESGAIYRDVSLLLPVDSYKGVQNIATPHHNDTCMLLIRRNGPERQAWILGFMKLRSDNDESDRQVFLGDQGWYLDENNYVILHENGLFEIRYGSGLSIYDAETGLRKSVVVRDELVLDKLNFSVWYLNKKNNRVGYSKSIHHTLEPLETSQKEVPSYSFKYGEECEDGLMCEMVIDFKYDNKTIAFSRTKTYRTDNWDIEEEIEGDGYSVKTYIGDKSLKKEIVYGEYSVEIEISKDGVGIRDDINSVSMDRSGVQVESKTGMVSVKANMVNVSANTVTNVRATNITLTGNVAVAGNLSAGPSGAPPLLQIGKSGANLGGTGGHPVPLGDLLITWLNSHTHTSSAPGSPTSPPITPATPATLLSKKMKAK